MAQFTQNTTTDLTRKGKRLSSVYAFSTAGGTVTLNDGVGGTARYKFTLGANGNNAIVFRGSKPVFVNGIQVAITGTDATATLDIL